MLQDFYAKLSDQEKMFLYGAIAALMIACLDGVFFQQIFAKKRDLDVGIAQTQNNITRSVRFLTYKNKIIAESKVYHKFQLSESKTEDEVTADFLKTLEVIASECGVSQGKVTPQEPVSKKGYILFYANLECSGKMENVVKFIHRIATTENLLKVVKMNMMAKKSSAEEVTVVLKIAKLNLNADATDAGSKGQEPEKQTLGAGGTIPKTSSPVNLKPKSKAALGATGTTSSPSGQKLNSPTAGGVSGATGTVTNLQGEQAQGIVSDGQAGNLEAQDPQVNAQVGGSANGGAGDAADETQDQDTENNKITQTGMLEQVNTGNRMQAKKGLWEVVSSFFGVKPKEEPEKPEPINRNEYYKSADEIKPNLWERVMSKKKNE